MPAPLIVTALLDAEVSGWLDDLRRTHFPAARNHLGAHLTLFHHLPGGEEDAVLAALRRSRPPGPLEGRVDRVLRLGRGVALGVEVPGLAQVRRSVAGDFADRLTAQDRSWGRPHVTIQNKVAPEQAAALAATLERDFAPRATRVEGLGLFRYLGGPWEPVAEVPLVPDGGSSTESIK